MESKEIGSLGEITFGLRAIKYGFHVSQPLVDSRKYDFIVEGKKLFKVQVKTTSQGIKRNPNAYRFIIGHGSTGKRAYTNSDVDIIVLYILPIDTFYIIPINEIKALNTKVYPLKDDHRLSKYKEAWSIFK